MGMEDKAQAEFRGGTLDIANDCSHLLPLSGTQGFTCVHRNAARDLSALRGLPIGQNQEFGSQGGKKGTDPADMFDHFCDFRWISDGNGNKGGQQPQSHVLQGLVQNHGIGREITVRSQLRSRVAGGNNFLEDLLIALFPAARDRPALPS